MRKTFLMALGLFAFIYAKAQTGIQFEQNLTWNEIKAKAKSEHKYIFVDCYATWCVPCKTMDAEVYPKKEVGDVYNREFISVKIQMDSTKADDEPTKKQRVLASQLQNGYAINGFPTFMFFDPDGNPVHKAIGSQNATDFIELASAAHDPKKQYYTIVKNFEPGKLDTTELGSLINVFIGVDEGLTRRMAADLLSRIHGIHLAHNRDFMLQFQNDPDILPIILRYVAGLNKEQFVEPDNVKFLSKLKRHAEAQALVVNYLTQLNRKAINQEQILALTVNYSKQPKVQQWAISFIKSLTPKELATNQAWLIAFEDDAAVSRIAHDYVNSLSEKDIYSKMNLSLIAALTKSTTDNYFDLFYHHADAVNKVQGVNFAEQKVIGAIITTELDSHPDQIKENKDWDEAELRCEKKYGRLGMLAVRKKRFVYFSDIDEKDARDFGIAYRLYYEKIGSLDIYRKNDSAFEVFKYVDDTDVINLAVKIMEPLKGAGPNEMDTYACLMYKAGNTAGAVKEEEKYLQFYADRNDQSKADYAANKIKAMKRGEKIWEIKEYL